MSDKKSNPSGFVIIAIVFAFAFLLISPFGRIIYEPISHVFKGLSSGFLGLTGPFNWPHGGQYIFPFFPAMVMWAIGFIIVIWVYNDAERNNMSGILWALLVFVGNVVGLIIYLIVRSSGNIQPVPPVQPIQPLVTKTCDSCHKPVQNDFAHCPHCGANLKNECPSCKKDVESAWKVCPYCGTDLKEKE